MNATNAPDTAIDQARELLKTALFAVEPQIRPQDAAATIADLAYLTPTLDALIRRVREALADTSRIPGLYTTIAERDAASVVDESRAHLAAAAVHAEQLRVSLDAAHQLLSSLGHAETTSRPLAAVPDTDNERPAPPN